MEKHTHTVSGLAMNMYVVFIVLLTALLIVVGLKYAHLKLSVRNFTQSAMMMNANQTPTGTISDYASIVATTVTNYPAATPLYTQPAALQNYVATISKELKRDVVVIDTTKKILADTVAANVGKSYTYDTDGIINDTLQDGVSRSFIEKSTDYPQGISEVAVAMKNTNNQIVGVVLVSNTKVSK